MGLTDLFRPRWKHSHSWVRKAAVGKLTDQATLAEISKNDEAFDVREAAVMRLTDQKALADVAIEDSEKTVRKAAFVRINDEKLIAEVAKSSSDYGIYSAAVKRVSDPELLAALVREAQKEEARRLAAERVDDQDVLFIVAKEDKHWAVRREAVRKLTGQERIAQIAEHDTDEAVRVAAALKLKDRTLAQRIFAEIATATTMSRKESGAPFEAVKHLTSQAALASAAKSSCDYGAASEAAGRVTDQALLADLVQNGEPSVRRIVVARITDQKLLAGVAEADGDGAVRVVAASRLSDTGAAQKVFAEVALTDSEKHNRFEAVRRLTDQALLAQIVRSDATTLVRLEAAARIKDQSVAQPVIATVARGDKDPGERRVAVRLLHDQALLLRIAETDGDRDVREEAAARAAMLGSARARIWFQHREDAEDSMKVRLAAQYSGAPEHVLAAIYAGRYSVVPNTEDNRGGVFVLI